jgi:fatty-acid desaturase
MHSYNLVGSGLLLAHAVASALLAPPTWGLWGGLAGGVVYLVFLWFLGGNYLSNVLHLGIAHGALDFKPWFIKTLALVNNTVGIYIDPKAWVNRHRHHHEFADRPGDPSKLEGDGFWKTLYLCVRPYPCQSELANDAILATWPLRLVSTPAFAVFSQLSSYAVVWLVVGDWAYALALWIGARLVGLWVNMIQNFWSHDRRFGTRRYPDPDDNAMNIGHWLPVTATFSACLQNNHHHYPHLLRTSHDPAEYDFGFLTIRWLTSLGLVRASATGAEWPEDLVLKDLKL